MIHFFFVCVCSMTSPVLIGIHYGKEQPGYYSEFLFFVFHKNKLGLDQYDGE